MTPDQQAKLLHAAPILYRVGMEFECGDGWADLLLELSLKLEAICIAQSAKGEVPLLARQVKVKFGGLRFYLDAPNAGATVVINRARAQAAVTCEECGEPGTRYLTEGWYSTRCALDVP